MDRYAFARRQGWIAALCRPGSVPRRVWCRESCPYDWLRWPLLHMAWVGGYWSYFYIDSPPAAG